LKKVQCTSGEWPPSLMYDIPRRRTIFALVYADDTQLLISFSALDFSHNITYLENTITNVSNWMSSNYLSLNPSKTEFLIFDLPQQFSKLNNPTIHLPNNVILSPLDSAHNLDIIFDTNLSFAQHITAVSKSCFHNILDRRRIRSTNDQTTACTIATSLIHYNIDYSNSLLLHQLLHNQNVFNLSLTLLQVLSPKLLNFTTLANSEISPMAQDK